MMSLSDYRQRIVEGARENRELWISLTCLWLVAWAAAGYGQQVLIPQVLKNSEDIGALKEQVEDVQIGVNGLHLKFDESQAQEMRDRIFELGVSRCEATSHEARQLYQRRIDDIRDRYHALTGRQAPMPPRCAPDR